MFWILGSVSGFWELFWHSGKCFVPMGHRMSSIHSIMFLASPLCLTILLHHVLFAFSAYEFSVVPRVFVYLLNVCRFCIWGACNNFRFQSFHSSTVDVIELAIFHLPSCSIFLCSFIVSSLTGSVSLFVTGVLAVWWLLYAVMVWLFVFNFSVCIVCHGHLSGVNQRLGIG